MKKITHNHFRVPAGKKVNLTKWPTRVKPVYKSKKKYSKLLQKQVEELSALQRLHYASNGYAVLLIFQALDAAGKDGAIQHVMSGVNPQGCQVFSCTHPSATELDHDFLWCTTQALPERGRIGIFNRSYYKEVLIVRVHPETLRTQGLPDTLRDEKAVWQGRDHSIVDLENHLYRNGTRILKFFLHLRQSERSVDHFRDHPRRLQRVTHDVPRAQRETPAGAADDTQEAYEVTTYRNGHRLESSTLGKRLVCLASALLWGVSAFGNP